MNTMRSKVAQFQRHLCAQTLFDGTTPLLDILRRRILFNGGEANGSRAQHRRSEVEVTGDDAGRRSEVVALLRLGKDIGNIVPLVAPGIHVHRSEEDSKRGMEHNPMTGNAVRDARAGREVKLVRRRQTRGKTLLPADENE